MTPAPAQSRDDVQDRLRRHRDDGQVHRGVDVPDPGVGLQAQDLARLGVDREDRAGEAAGEDVLQHQVPDRVRPPAGADHRDRPGEEHAAHAHRLGTVLAGQDHGLRLLGRGDREGDGDDAVVVVVADLVAGLGEHRDHLAVLRQDVGDEPAHPLLLGDRREVLQQHRPHTPALVGVGDVERHLGGGRVDAVVAAMPMISSRTVATRATRSVVVDLGEAGDVAVAELLQRREEAQVDRLGGLAGVEAPDAVGVLGPDRAHVGHRAVPQDDVRLPLGGIGHRWGGGLRHGLRIARSPRGRRWHVSAAGPRASAPRRRRSASTTRRHRPGPRRRCGRRGRPPSAIPARAPAARRSAAARCAPRRR